MDETLQVLIQRLQDAKKLWLYETRITEGTTEEQKREIALQVLTASKPWAQRLYEEMLQKQKDSEERAKTV